MFKPLIDVDRYISLWETAISLEEDISENGIRLENGKKNESVALLVSVNKQIPEKLKKGGKKWLKREQKQK